MRSIYAWSGESILKKGTKSITQIGHMNEYIYLFIHRQFSFLREFPIISVAAYKLLGISRNINFTIIRHFCHYVIFSTNSYVVINNLCFKIYKHPRATLALYIIKMRVCAHCTMDAEYP